MNAEYRSIAVLLTKTVFTTLVLFCASIVSGMALATDAYLELPDQSFGQGTLIKSGNECFIITPKHVLFDDDGFPRGSPVRVVYGDRSETQADLHKAFDGDLALLRLRSQPAFGCVRDPFETAGVSKILAGNTQAVLERKGFDGSSNFVHLLIVQSDAYGAIQTKPMLEGDTLQKGYSGSAILIDNVAVGMLTNVVEGVGISMRSDLIMASLSTFLAAAQSSRSLHITLDEKSQFLKPIITQQANNAGVPIEENEKNAARRLLMTSREIRNDDSAGPVVRYETSIRFIDSLDRELFNKEVIATGNSFIDMDSAVRNAKESLVEAISSAALIENMP
ncbi:MAG: hypothetical protein AB8B79_05900 [Granulosicoccus sp.]